MKCGYLLIGVLMFLSTSSCGGKAGPSEAPARKPAVSVRVQSARQEDISRRLALDGSIEPVRVAKIASPAEGPIQDLWVREGDRIGTGQLLVRVGRSRMAETGLDAARAEQHRQEAELKRVEQLVQSGSLPGEQLEIARANFKKAQAQVAAAETGAGDYEIKAPWNGVVSKVWIAEGNYVAPRAPLLEVYDPASLILRFAVPEESALAVEKGAAVEVKLDAYPGQVFRAAVNRLYPELDRRTRTRTVEAAFPDSVALAPGMYARVSLPVETAHRAVIVPDNAVLTTPRGDLVVFVVEGGKASRRLVKTGVEDGHRVQIVSGIQPGEPVVVAGHEKLRDGQPVRVLKTAASKPHPDRKEEAM